MTLILPPNAHRWKAVRDAQIDTSIRVCRRNRSPRFQGTSSEAPGESSHCSTGPTSKSLAATWPRPCATPAEPAEHPTSNGWASWRFYTNLWVREIPRLEAQRQAQLTVLNDPGGRIGGLALTQSLADRSPQIREPEMRHALAQEAEARKDVRSGIEVPARQTYRFTTVY